MMANMSDILLSKLESISWLYSIKCQINGQNSTILLKYIIEEDFYAVMATDLTLTYFECLEGKDIDDHYKRFNKGEIKRERLLSHLKTILKDVTKADSWSFGHLVVDCHTSRLTLKVSNRISILKFEWSFYMISTNPETLSRHLTIPLFRSLSSLRTGIDLLFKEIKNKDKLLEQMDENKSKSDFHSDNNAFSVETLINKIKKSSTISIGNDDNSSLIEYLLNDRIVNAIMTPSLNSDNSAITDTPNKSSNIDNQSSGKSKKKEKNSDEV
jgi:hypothetical protein